MELNIIIDSKNNKKWDSVNYKLETKNEISVLINYHSLILLESNLIKIKSKMAKPQRPEPP